MNIIDYISKDELTELLSNEFLNHDVLFLDSNENELSNLFKKIINSKDITISNGNELKFNDITIKEIIQNIKQDECKEISNQFLNSISAYFVRFYTKDKDVEKLINEINNGNIFITKLNNHFENGEDKICFDFKNWDILSLYKEVKSA